jgi:hypothetical protein
MKDPIIEEIRKVRDDMANEVDYDVRALGRRLQKSQKNSKSKVVSLSPSSVEEDIPAMKTAKK